MIRVTIFQKRQTWWVNYRLNGKRIRRSLETKNQKTAERKAKEIEKRFILGESEGVQGRRTFEAFWDEYLPYAESSKRPKSVYNDKYIWKRFSEWLTSKGLKFVDQVTSQIFEEYRLFLHGNNLQPISVNHNHRHIRAMLSAAARMGYIETNPIKKIRMYRIEQTPPQFLNEDQINHLMEQAVFHGPRMSMIYGLGIYAGMRNSEIINARWEWFDFENNVILIQSFGKFVPKSHRSRPIPLNSKLKYILLKNNKKEGYLFRSYKKEEERKSLVRFDYKNAFATVKERNSNG